MERFEKAQVGDLVYCRRNGNGKIDKFIDDMENIFVSFEDSITSIYTISGKYMSKDKEQILFYRKGGERYLTERPEPEIDWATVAPGTVCLVTNHSKESYVERVFLCLLDGDKWFKSPAKDHATIWNYARIK